MSPTQISRSTHDQFMRTVREELEAAEKRENTFLAEERRERAASIRFTAQEPAPPH